MKQWLTIICVGFFLLTVGIFFYPTILSGNLPVPADTLIGLYHPWRDLYAATNPRGVPFKNFLITDPVRQQIPWRKVAIDQWKKGQLPLWNPYSFAGTPLAANIQAGVFYPFNFLFFLFDFPIAWTLLIVFQPLLAGLFLFVYLRHHNLHPLASLFGAIAWSFSGFNIAWLTWGTMMHVALWLPLVLLSIDKLTEAPKLSQNIAWLVFLAFGFAMQVFAGHIQIALYCIGVAVAYAGYRIWRIRAKRGKSVLWITLGVGIFILVTTIQWVPMMKWVFESGRIAEGENWMREGWFLPWQHLVQFLVPDFFGNPATLNYWGIWNYGEFIGYIGAIPLLFALLSFFGGKSKDGVFWIGVTTIAFLFVLPTPLAKLPYLMRLPVFSTLQPTRLMAVIDFSLVVLAAFGFDGWLRNKERRNWGAILIVGIIFIVLWIIVQNGGVNLQVSKRNIVLPSMFFITGSVLLLLPSLLKKYTKAHIVGLLLVGITVFDLLRFGWKFTPFTPKEYFFPETQIISFLKQQEKPFRVMSTDNRILPPNVSAYYGIEAIEGYDPLLSQRYEEMIAAIARGKPDITPPFGFNRIVTLESIDSPLLPIFNVRYVLSLSDIDRPFLKKLFQEGETRVYEYTRELPRAYLVSEVRAVNDKEGGINELFSASFDPATSAVVEGLVNKQNFSGFAKGTARITSYAAGRIDIETETSGEGYLVVSDSYTPDWKVFVDGTPKTIFRTNYNFLGAIVPGGAHRVKFSL